MRFWLDLASCYRPPVEERQRLLREEPDGGTVQVVLVSGCNETWSKPRRKKMIVSRYWRPELSFISEDKVVSFMEIDQGRRKCQYHQKYDHHRSVKNVSMTHNKTRSRRANPIRTPGYNYTADYYDHHPRKHSLPMATVPVFRPAPSMFR